ncbi:MAG: hypothetical protein ACP5VR_05940 [Acidimicrobiales bacterium]
MAQPEYVPVVAADRVRPSERLPAARRWEQKRPAEIVALRHPVGLRLGSTGPNLGFGLKLAKKVASRAVLTSGEHLEDAVAGCFVCGARRASTFHRAPVVHDMEWAFTLWGFMPGAPAALVAYRAPLFAGASHDYVRQRAIADALAQAALLLTTAQVSERLDNWQSLLVIAR